MVHDASKSITVHVVKPDHGSLEVSNITATEGAVVQITPVADPGYALKTLSVAGENEEVITVSNGAFTMPASSVTVSAIFSKLYTVTVGNSAHGSVSVDKTSAMSGEKVSLTVQAEEGYTLSTIGATDNAGNVEITDYSFSMPDADVLVMATFAQDLSRSIDNGNQGGGGGSSSNNDNSGSSNTTPKKENPFTDITEKDYFYDPALWAYEKGITTGVREGIFAPYNITTRAEMVTFLWRAKGSVEPTTTNCPFEDIKASDYYYKAVLWGYENGYVKGTNETHFSPDLIITRSQAVTFLARLAGVNDEAEGYTHHFTDVASSEYYSNAVAWAYERGITTGITETTFGPLQQCSRGEIVTFLYRYFK